MKPKQHHYRLLHFINWALTPESPGVHIEHLVHRMQITNSECRKYLLEMADHTFSESGAWVERSRGDNWMIRGVCRDNHSTGGYKVLEALKRNVYLEDNNEREWCEMTRAGIDSTGNETAVENAVIPSGTVHNMRTDPESAVKRSNSKFQEPGDPRFEDSPIEKDGVKLCPRCDPRCKRPVHLKSQYCSLHQKLKDRADYPRKKIQRRMEREVQNEDV